ncbi:MAG: HAD family hydrolase [Hadesarchaea archaeon]|jgi:putative hydrolase of the HAD superfamily|nr:HAD family hydrolase [Hadesarchaea archaeon]TDA32407.1 MAG: HAD family hydrolase [Hadesarchaea archaeon]
MRERISLDLDGTLVDMSFANRVWLEEIPRLYSLRHGLPLEEARRVVKAEYDRVGDGRLEWYDLRYWLGRFDLRVEPEELFERCREAVRAYPEVPGVLEELRGEGYGLILLTNAPREFASFQLRVLNLEGYFDRIFSSFSDFRKIKRSEDTYRTILELCGLSPSQLVHVGDHFEHDYLVPRRLGIRAFYLDRRGRMEGDFVLRDLRELKGKLENGSG